MSSNTTEGNQSYPHDKRSTVTQEDFAALVERVEALEQEKDERISELEETVARQSEEIEELREELSQHRDESARERAEIKQRVTSLEEDEETAEDDETPTPQTEETTIQEPETPLEDVVQLPEHLVAENLSANQQRARFVAKDIHEYSRSVPAGRVLKSSELRRVLSAGEDGTVYTETVSRVIRFLEELGGDDVQVRETQAGERVVVFSDEIVKRIVAYHNQSNSVVTGEEVTG